MPFTAREFIDSLIASGLASAEELPSFAGAWKSIPDAERAARLMVDSGRLTRFQARLALQRQAAQLVLGNYVIQDRLGQGGMGTVFKACHRRMDRVVALKIISPAKLTDPETAARFSREVRAAARLHHSHIVTAYDADVAGGLNFLVMQHIEGADLASVIRRHGPLTRALAIRCCLQAAKGLSHAHEQGVIHCDVKPSNLLLEKGGTIKILDMGLARLSGPMHADSCETDLADSGYVMGTADYVAPEQAENHRSADAGSDQYSLGCTLHYLLTKRPTYLAANLMEKLLAHRQGALPSLVAGLRTTPTTDLKVRNAYAEQELNSVFQKMISKKPADRFASMDDVVYELRRLLPLFDDDPDHTDSAPGDPALASLLAHLPDEEGRGENEKGSSLTAALSPSADLQRLWASMTAPTLLERLTFDHPENTSDPLAVTRPLADLPLQQKTRLIAGVSLFLLIAMTIGVWKFQTARRPVELGGSLKGPARDGRAGTAARRPVEATQLIPLVSRENLGDGSFSDVTVQDQTVTLDSSQGHSPQVWMNFLQASRMRMELGATISIDQDRPESIVKLVLLSATEPEFDTVIRRSESGDRYDARLEVASHDGSIRILDERDVTNAIRSGPIQYAISLSGDRLSVELNGARILSAAVVSKDPRTAAIATLNCRAAFTDPYLAEPSTDNSH